VLCEREGGRLWGVSLCSPMVLADAATRSIATNQPAPAVQQPAYLGFANSAMDWGGVRWSTFVWGMIPTDENARRRMMLHELFHRIQPQLGLLAGGGQNDHVDTPDGRYWLQLEWRALAKALGGHGAERTAAVRDALAFRLTRRKLFPGAAGNERPEEIREGLAQYTGTVVSAVSTAEAAASAIRQLAESARIPSFVGIFAYASGAAYGILLDAWSPGWTRQVKASDDLGQLLMAAAQVQPSENAEAAAMQYGSPELKVAEEKREAEWKARIADCWTLKLAPGWVVRPGSRPGDFQLVGDTHTPPPQR